MKNKDGIVIKPEQEWELYGFGLEAKVIGFDGPVVVCAYDDEYRDFDCDDFDELLKSHDGADLEAARAGGWTPWTDGMDRPDPEKVETVETWGDAKRWFEPHRDFCSSKNWSRASYRYKLKKEPVGYQAYKDAPDHQDPVIAIFSEDDYIRCDIDNPRVRSFRKLADAEAWLKEDEKPRYKLFEIDWRGVCPEVEGFCVAEFPRVEDVRGFQDQTPYQIFGFTDDKFSARAALTEMVMNKHYETEPCDHMGNRKYAIGRLI